MDTVDIKTFACFAVIDALYWGFIAAFAGYCSTYLLACGLSSTMLSMILAVYMAFSFVGAFFWGGMCDKLKTNKKVFIPEITAALVVALVIYFLASKNVIVAACIYPLFGFLFAPLGSNLDSWMLRSFNRDALVYGRARSLGSAGYAVVMLVMGNLIARFGYKMIPIAASTLALIVILMAVIMKEEPYGDKGNTVKPSNPTELLKIKPYIFMVIILFLTGLAVSPINNLKIVILQSVGGDVSNLGLDSFIGVMVQAVFIFISGNLRKIPAYVRMTVMSVCTLVTTVMVFLAGSPAMIIIGTVFANVSYGFMLPTMREITEKSVKGSLKNTAHSLSDAMFGSFAGIIALLYSGVLMDSFGARSVALLGAGIMIIPVAMSVFRMLKDMKQAKA